MSRSANSLRIVLVVLGAAALAACAQSPASRQRADIGAGKTVVQHAARPAPSPVRSVVMRPTVTDDAKEQAAHGLASFYSYDSQTASGEKFDKNELTAAHPTLPFGTRVRVTNVATGRAVTVRVNDRGPYVRGRIVDVSYSAAEALGMVNQGVANVRLDVVQ